MTAIRMNVAGLVGHAFALVSQARDAKNVEDELRQTIRRIAAQPEEPIKALSGWTPEGLEEVCVGLDQFARTAPKESASSLALAARLLRQVGEQHFKSAASHKNPLN